jgi:Aminoglycoside/hydroxyurea antibiotic resistance kinase
MLHGPPWLARQSQFGWAEDPDERRLLINCAARFQELITDRIDNRLLHWDLHYFNTLSTLDAARKWKAIDPKPLSGDSGFELLPALWNRWDDLVRTGDLTRALLRRFDLMTDVLGLDRSRAASWSLGRVLQMRSGILCGSTSRVSNPSIASLLTSSSPSAPNSCERRNRAPPVGGGGSRGVLSLRATTTAADSIALRIARRCPGRTNEQTRFSSVSERGRQRPQSAILASGASNQTLREQL